MSKFSIHARKIDHYGRPAYAVTLIVQGGRGIRDRMLAAIAYGQGHASDDDVKVEGDSVEGHRAMLRALNTLEGRHDGNEPIEVTREYSVVQERFIYRARIRGTPAKGYREGGDRTLVTVVVAH